VPKNDKAKRSHERRHDHGAAQRGMPFGKAGHQWKGRKSRQRGHCRDDPDPGRIDPHRAQPHREKRQVAANQAEDGAIEQRKAAGESGRAACRWHGDL
jgi:hypothetical protein